MYVKTITYTDYNGNERTGNYYFHISKAELADKHLSTPGGLRDQLEEIIHTNNVPELAKIFKDIIHESYGVKSPDGNRFIKNQEVLDEFTQSEAYSVLYMELATNAEEAARFVEGILPKDLVDDAKKG